MTLTVPPPEPWMRRDEEQQPQRVRVSEDDIRDRRRHHPDHERRAASVPVGEASPHRRAEQLRDRERRHEQADNQPVRAKRLGVERHERNDHQRSDHVDERGDH